MLTQPSRQQFVVAESATSSAPVHASPLSRPVRRSRLPPQDVFCTTNYCAAAFALQNDLAKGARCAPLLDTPSLVAQFPHWASCAMETDRRFITSRAFGRLHPPIRRPPSSPDTPMARETSLSLVPLRARGFHAPCNPDKSPTSRIHAKHRRQ